MIVFVGLSVYIALGFTYGIVRRDRIVDLLSDPEVVRYFEYVYPKDPARAVLLSAAVALAVLWPWMVYGEIRRLLKGPRT